ncbi:MAG TPA: DCC1-like thiol-disulfide oxidoreductase family protein [Saprospiraceae bacterium]|nr:DCC1-like thiol-disulfide oxidoreductase family protein [Saprospiraceae bacterium]
MQLPDRLIIFDGECIYCNRIVHLVLLLNKNKDIKLTVISPEINQLILDQMHEDIILKDSFAYLRKGNIYFYSDAALWVMWDMNWMTASVAGIFLLIPKLMRDSFYKWISRNRIRWFGKTESCKLIPKKYEQHILDFNGKN